ncbi:cell division protein SepF [Corynebacterium sp. 335C]
MAEFMQNVKRYFGMEPVADARDADDYADERRYERPAYADDHGYDDRAYDEYEDDYADDYADYEAPRYVREEPAPAPAPRRPVHHRITPQADFVDKYSEAREIGERFRDGDIVTFDLADLPMEQRKRYIDFAAGLSFALRGRIEADGNVFTLLPEGVEAADAGRDALSG